MKYIFIKKHRSIFRLGKMCQVLSVSKSGYYSWLNRRKSKSQLANKTILQKIREIFDDNYQRYGYRRVWFELHLQGTLCSKNRVARLMKADSLKAKRIKRFKMTTKSKHNLPVSPNLLNRDFSVTAPNCVWVSDITYIWTREGWMYLAVVIDLYARKVVGWSMSKRINKELVLSALNQAIDRRRPAAGLIFHSDRGSQYASKEVRHILEKHSMIQSMSRKGDCYDNAVAESFFATLKTELVYPYFFATRLEARSEIFEYIEIYYNRRRIHSYLNYMTPDQFERTKLAA
jgi:putative transposase